MFGKLYEGDRSERDHREATWGKGFLSSRPGTLLSGGLLRLENSEDR